ncbi:MAG TPA: hypothetical protein VFI11_15895 [Anaerolineales bacterium]|nr:hypothetical protein [Anaerolineales bacterium]
MDEVLLLLQARQAWIYLVLAIVGLVYARIAWRRLRTLRTSLFGLERERALRGLTRATAMLGLVLGGGLFTFVAATFVAPAVPASSRPTPLPTVSLLLTPGVPPAQGTDFVPSTPLPQAPIDSAGCQNPAATLTSPKDGDSLAGLVSITGTANITNFAFFKYEYIPISGGAPMPGAVWRAISAGTKPVLDGELGSWDTSIVTPGDYALRLVVTDTAGNAPLPCVVTLRILPAG